MIQDVTGVTIIIPAYNEANAIGPVLEHIQDVMTESAFAYQIIVVDDGSTDGTADVARSYDVDVISNPANRGYGAAIKTGIRQARYDIIVITDADGTYPNEEIPQLLAAMDTYDMVVGARTGESVHIPLVRRPAKWFIRTLANVMAKAYIPDLNSGLRAFRKELALQFFPVLPDGFSLTSTITLAMLENGYLVKYIPINYHKRVGKSKINPIRDTLNFTLLIIRTTTYYAPLRVFFPLSAFLLLVGLAVGLYSMFVLGRIMDVTTVILVISALQVAATGLLADMINKRTPRF
jgi:glycosyltransferase involved in cell wall biosynthesis